MSTDSQDVTIAATIPVQKAMFAVLAPIDRTAGYKAEYSDNG